MTEITLEFLQNLLAEVYPDVTLHSFESAPGSNQGDNYISILYRISLNGIRKNNQSDDINKNDVFWENSIIYKCLPESVNHREVYKSDELFRNEAAFYNKIWPALSTFQSLRKVKRPFTFLPKCYLAKNDIIILKDLKQYGFVMADRKKGLTIEQSYLVLKNLAHFHSLSLAMKCQNPESFYELLEGISEVYFLPENEEFYKPYFNQAVKNAQAMIEEELQDNADKDMYLEKFHQFANEDTYFKTMLEFVKPKEPLAVIGHGDCWTNNFLFKSVDGDITEMCLIDFQMIRYASPALDLVYIMYLCLDKQQRAEHLSSLFEYYVDELHSRLLDISDEDSVYHSSLNRDAMFEILQKEFKHSSRFGLGVALDMLPAMMCDSDEAPDLYEAETAFGDCITPVSTSNTACRKKMTDLVQELVDEGLL